MDEEACEALVDPVELIVQRVFEDFDVMNVAEKLANFLKLVAVFCRLKFKMLRRVQMP